MSSRASSRPSGGLSTRVSDRISATFHSPAQATVRSLAARGAGVAQIARRMRLPQDVVSMLLAVPFDGRQNESHAAASASLLGRIGRIFRRMVNPQVVV